MLFSKNDVLVAITNLRLPYTDPILQDLDEPPKATRTAVNVMPPGNLQTKEGSSAQPTNLPPLIIQQGSDYTDFACLAVGAGNRGELRRIEDFLAQYGYKLDPVSSFDLLIFHEWGDGSPSQKIRSLRRISGRPRSFPGR